MTMVNTLRYCLFAAALSAVPIREARAGSGQQVSTQFSLDDSKPNEPLINLNEIFANELRPVKSAGLSNGKTLTIYAPPGFVIDERRIAGEYERFMAEINRVGAKPFSRDIRLLIFLFDVVPHHIQFSRPTIVNGAPVQWDYVMLDRNVADPEREVICRLSRTEPHEMAHSVISVAYRSGRGWYEEGQAEYLKLVATPAGCEDGRAREAALAAFADGARRRELWKFCPGCYARKLMRAGLQKNPAKRATLFKRWETISQGYVAASGAFFFLERKLGREKLLALLQAVNRAHRKQNRDFYRDLGRRLGFDLRELTDAQVQSALALEAGPAAN